MNSSIWLATMALAIVLHTLTAGDAAPLATSRPLVGAIRWDAWTGGPITAVVEQTLAPAKYRFRLPWFAEIAGDGRVHIDGGRQEVMDREIAFAADAGLDYWAFLIYAHDDAMATALAQYLRSDARNRLGFCAILHNTLSSTAERWPRERDRLVALMGEPGYVRVCGGRPLLYLFHGDFLRSDQAGRLQELRDAARQVGFDPYLVYMGWNPQADYAQAKPAGFAAVSAYAFGSNGRFDHYGPFVQDLERRYWEQAAQAQVPLVPLVSSGWDKRPRIDHPVPWEKGQGYLKETRWMETPRPEEIAAHLARGLRFVDEHPALCPARTLIIYAWNEYDEGGWMAPTRQADGTPDAGRLQAMRAVLRRD